jgi:hypothetical protein
MCRVPVEPSLLLAFSRDFVVKFSAAAAHRASPNSAEACAAAGCAQGREGGAFARDDSTTL